MPLNYDDIDINDPNLDFETQQAILVDALKGAKELQKPQFQTYRGQAGVIAPWTAGASLGNIANRLAGQIDQRQVNRDLTGLNREELQRYQEGIQGLGEIDPNTDFNDPASIAKVHAAQQQRLGGLMRLPMARKLAEQGMIKGANFPETLAQLKMKQLDSADRQAERIAAQAERDALRNQNALTIAAMNNATRRDIADNKPGQQTPEDKARAKAQAEFPKATGALTGAAEHASNLMLAIDDVRTAPGLNWATGVTGKYTPSTVFTEGETAEVERRVANLKAQTMKAGRDMMNETGKIGSMAVAEWPIVEAAYQALDLLKSGTEGFKTALADAEMKTRNFFAKAASLYKDQAEYAGSEDVRIPNLDDIVARKKQMRADILAGKKPEVATETPTATRNSALPRATGNRGGTKGIQPDHSSDEFVMEDTEGYPVYRRTKGSGKGQMYTTNPNPKVTPEPAEQNAPTVVEQKRGKGGVLYNIYSDGTAEPAGGQ